MKRDTRFDKEIADYLKDSKIAVLLTVSPEEDEVERSKTTLDFGSKLA